MKRTTLNTLMAAVVGAVITAVVVQISSRNEGAVAVAQPDRRGPAAPRITPPPRVVAANDAPAAPSNAGETMADVARRLEALEKSLERLQKVVEILAPEKASEDRALLFAAEDGYLKADEFFELEKFAIAGEGYLTFLQSHPQHPDAQDIMKRARDAFQRAGYTDKALWVQQEMLKSFPQERAKNLFDLAMMEKAAGRMDDAIQHAAESAALAANDEDRLWRLLYRAWYIELRDGKEVGLSAYREVQGMIDTAGQRDRPLGERARTRIADLEARIAKGQGKRRAS